jgi:hypothetical protein
MVPFSQRQCLFIEFSEEMVVQGIMKKMIGGLAKWLIMLLLISGCSTKIYGVSKETWQQMSDPQKQEAIKGHNERELLEEERRLLRAKRFAYDASWRHGKRYENITLGKCSNSEGRGLILSVHIIRAF